MKKSILIFGLSIVVLMVHAQRYVVTSITGKVICEEKNGEKGELKLRQTLTPQSTLNLSYKAQVELLDEQGKKKYLLKVPGRGVLGEMLKDRQNSVMQLTEQYLAYMRARVKGKGEMTAKRHSDPATVTREVAVKKQGAAEEFSAFRQQATAQYEQFRQQAIREYAAFMRKAWQTFEASPAQPLPKEDQVEPEIAPENNMQETPQSNPVITDNQLLFIPVVSVQPVPSSPIKEQEEEEGEYVEFELYGTSLRVRFTGKEQFELKNLSESTVADVFERLQSNDFNNTIRDCLELRIRHQLCDWAYLKMLDAFSKACFSTPNEATLLMAFIYQQSGYKMRLGVAGDQLVMLYASRHTIFSHSYYNVGGDCFYPYSSKANSMRICEAAYPKENYLSLWISQTPMLAEDRSDERTLKSDAYELELGVSVNKNLLAFYNDYPSSKVNDNDLSRWAIYANLALEPAITESLLPTFREKLSGLSELEAMERLLNWVQTAFEYKLDDKVWGHDRAFFADETLYYPYADCEDRSILLSRLVRDLLGLPTILVYYPGHLAMAVAFSDNVFGDYIILDGKRFVVCDPTYINARVGQTMPKMNNETAKVILLAAP